MAMHGSEWPAVSRQKGGKGGKKTKKGATAAPESTFFTHYGVKATTCGTRKTAPRLSSYLSTENRDNREPGRGEAVMPTFVRVGQAQRGSLSEKMT